jgi:hypothetical protein
MEAIAMCNDALSDKEGLAVHGTAGRRFKEEAESLSTPGYLCANAVALANRKIGLLPAAFQPPPVGRMQTLSM